MVWSDLQIQKLAKEFVTVADEVYMLYPEDAGNLNRVKNDPAHLFFKKFGEAMPPRDWNARGTKQGIYMMGPNGEYLEGKFAAASNAPEMRVRLQRALTRWESLRTEKSYANLPVPVVKTGAPPEVSGATMILKVNLRDVPRGPGDRSGARFSPADHTTESWPDFTKWAWNENWIGFDDPARWVPRSSSSEPVPAAEMQRLAREMLVDNVRGQAPGWQPSAIKGLDVTMRRTSVKGGLVTIVYAGSANLTQGANSFAPKIYGEAVWNSSAGAFTSFDWVVIGPRTGAWQFNQREQDRGPAPMGIAISLFKPN